MSNLAGFSFNFLDKNAFKPYSIGIGLGGCGMDGKFDCLEGNCERCPCLDECDVGAIMVGLRRGKRRRWNDGGSD